MISTFLQGCWESWWNDNVCEKTHISLFFFFLFHLLRVMPLLQPLQPEATSGIAAFRILKMSNCHIFCQGLVINSNAFNFNNLFFWTEKWDVEWDYFDDGGVWPTDVEAKLHLGTHGSLLSLPPNTELWICHQTFLISLPSEAWLAVNWITSKESSRAPASYLGVRVWSLGNEYSQQQKLPSKILSAAL